MKKIVVYHIIPLTISLVSVGLILWGLSISNITINREAPVKKEIEAINLTHNGHAGNLNKETNQVKLFHSLNQNWLTVFGSSEFTSSVYAPYNFLPDSCNIPAYGIGQGYHQSLNILIECLAFEEEIEGKNICLILSPGWFESNGTNPDAFLKFSNSNLLSRIILNKSINEKYKNQVGKFIYENRKSFETMSYQMEYLQNSYLEQTKISFTNFQSKVKKKIEEVIPLPYSFDTIEYTFNPKDSFESKKKKTVDFEKISKKIKSRFLSLITTNSVFISDEYYTTYLKKDFTREFHSPKFPNQELEDFKKLIHFLIEKRVKISLVIQPLNPYFYTNLKAFNPIRNEIIVLAKKHQIPLLDFYVTSKNEYEPGILKDIMHTGDYGWLKINSFLINEHYEEK